MPSPGCALVQPAGNASRYAAGDGAAGFSYLAAIAHAPVETSVASVAQATAPCRVGLFITERLDRIQKGRLASGVVTEEHAHQRGEEKGRDNREHADIGG